MKKLFLLYLLCLTSSRIYGITPEEKLFNAIGNQNLKEVKNALQSANINAQDEDGTTPLIAAALEGNEEIFNEIVQKNPDINTTNNQGMNALIAATALMENVNIVNTLIARKAELNSKITQEVVGSAPGSTALIIATLLPNLAIAKALIDAGADVTIQDSNGKTALDYAKERKAFLEGFPEDDNTRAYDELVKLLTEKESPSENQNLLQSLNSFTLSLKDLGKTLG